VQRVLDGISVHVFLGNKVSDSLNTKLGKQDMGSIKIKVYQILLAINQDVIVEFVWRQPSKSARQGEFVGLDHNL
jgi:hypothetical protein